MMLSIDVAKYLITQGTVTAIGQDVFIGTTTKIPAGDGPLLTLNDTGGTSPVGTHDKVQNPYRRPSAQVHVRARQASDARTKIEQIYAKLVGIRNQTLNGTFYLWIRPIQEPMPLGLPDDNGRAQIVFNITSMRNF